MPAIAEKDGPQRVRRSVEEGAPIPVEDVVHEDLEAQAVAVEAEARVDVVHDDGAVVDARRGHDPMLSAGSIGLHNETPPSAASTCPVTQSRSNSAVMARATPSGVPMSPSAERSATRSR